MIQKRNIYSTLAQGFTAAVSQPKTATNRQNMNILISADPIAHYWTAVNAMMLVKHYKLISRQLYFPRFLKLFSIAASRVAFKQQTASEPLPKYWAAAKLILLEYYHKHHWKQIYSLSSSWPRY